jgi:hypothetical protein
MRNNLEEQLENLRQQGGKDVIPEAAASGVLNFVAITEMVEIPSRGKFYPAEHPLHGKDSVEIKQMTAKEEDILTNKSYIKKGILLDKLVESLLVNKSIPVQTLLVGDKNAIIIAARASAYGPEYKVAVSCVECGSKNNLNINLEDKELRDTEEIDRDLELNPNLKHTRFENGSILFQLPKTGWQVKCKLLNGDDEKRLMGFLETKKRMSENTDLTVLEQLFVIVEEINGISDKKILDQAISIMPAFDAKFLRTTYAKLIPNVTIQKRFSCSTCAAVQELEVPFTQEFFWPK